MGCLPAAAVGSANTGGENEDARASLGVHLQYDSGEQAKHGDQAQSLN